jgi:GNAT superfamily N-acetyltransferase
MTSSHTLLTESATAVFDDVPFNALSGEAQRFAGLTFPVLAERLRQIAEAETTKWFAVGGEHADLPMALALGVQDGDEALLVSIQVALPLRGSCLRRRLLAAWEKETIRRGVRKVSIRFSDQNPGHARLIQLLREGGWSEPSVVLCHLLGRAGAMAREGGEWKGVRGRVLQDAALSYEPLAFTETDEDAIGRLLSQPEAKPFPDPRRFLTTHIPDLSFAIRRRGALLGWLIAEPARAALVSSLNIPHGVVVDYKEFYLDAALWQHGYGLGAFYHAFIAQATLFGEDSLAAYLTHPGVPRMVALTRRRFAPMAIRFDTIFSCEKYVAES